MNPADDHRDGIPVLLVRAALALLRSAAALLLLAPILALAWLIAG